MRFVVSPGSSVCSLSAGESAFANSYRTTQGVCHVIPPPEKVKSGNGRGGSNGETSISLRSTNVLAVESRLSAVLMVAAVLELRPSDV